MTSTNKHLQVLIKKVHGVAAVNNDSEAGRRAARSKVISKVLKLCEVNAPDTYSITDLKKICDARRKLHEVVENVFGPSRQHLDMLLADMYHGRTSDEQVLVAATCATSMIANAAGTSGSGSGQESTLTMPLLTENSETFRERKRTFSIRCIVAFLVVAAVGLLLQQQILPIDCIGSWNEWSSCSRTCSNGVRRRTFNISIRPAHGGRGCPTSPQTQSCSTQPCPVDCNGSWEEWTTCSKPCGRGQQSRVFTTVRAQAYGGRPCPVSPKLRDCHVTNCPVDCIGSWQDWGACSSSCDPGHRARVINIRTSSSGGGRPCPPSPQVQDCEVVPCPIDCIGSWDEWTPCSQECGGGTRSRSFGISVSPSNDGVRCPSSPQERACNNAICSRDQCLRRFGSRGIDIVDQHEGFYRWQWQHTATVRDVGTGIEADSGHTASANGAIEHAKDALFEKLCRDGKLGACQC